MCSRLLVWVWKILNSGPYLYSDSTYFRKGTVDCTANLILQMRKLRLEQSSALQKVAWLGSGTPHENANIVGLSTLPYSPHVSRAWGWEPRTKSQVPGTQDIPSGPRASSKATWRYTCPSLASPQSSLEGAAIWGDTAPPGGGQLQGWAGRKPIGWEQGCGDEMTWEVGVVFQPPPPNFALTCDPSPLGKGDPNSELLQGGALWRNHRIN